MQFKKFIKNQGKALALALAIGILGAGAFFLTKTGEEEPEFPAEEVQMQDSERLEDVLQTAAPQPTVSEVSFEVVWATPDPTVLPEETPALSPETSKTPQHIREVLLMPLKNGKITKSFSGDEFTHFTSLNTWMTHNGIDIAAAEGSEVLAASSGKVSRVYDDATKGFVIEIVHNNGAKTIYAGFAEVSVSEEAKVSSGDVIGKLGTPPFESANGPHLHFEYIKDGKFCDPAALFS
ncbi:MAG: M23 family metallopeptidase [Christensenellaceae bacterium]|nr:M23 family metallopeptidase [Christensenellaceae bacterium]